MNHILGIATLSSLRLQLSAGTEPRPSPPAALRRPPCSGRDQAGLGTEVHFSKNGAFSI